MKVTTEIPPMSVPYSKIGYMLTKYEFAPSLRSICRMGFPVFNTSGSLAPGRSSRSLRPSMALAGMPLSFSRNSR